MAKPFKTIEAWAREIRSFVLPSHIAAAGRIVRERRIPGKRIDGSAIAPPVAVLDVRSLQIDRERGTYLYLLVRRLETAGYTVAIRNRFRMLANFQVRRHKRLLLARPWVVFDDPGVMPSSGGIWISDRELPPTGDWLSVRLDYDERRPMASHEVPFVFGINPDLWEIVGSGVTAPHGDGPRQRLIRLFFAGGADPKAYDSREIVERHRMIPRPQVLRIAHEAAAERGRLIPASELASSVMERVAKLGTRGEGWTDTVGHSRQSGTTLFVQADTRQSRLPVECWLNVLGDCDFFLAAPGVTFPHSHNVVEAMRSGAIPLLQYARYFDPPLEDGVNCIGYDSPESLAAAVRRILGMSAQDADLLRKGTREYYDQFLRPDRAIERVAKVAAQEGSATLLFQSFRAVVPAAGP